MTDGTPNHYISIQTAAGEEITKVVEFESAVAQIGVNTPGILQVKYKGDLSFISQLEHRSQIVLYRRDPINDIDWYPHFTGIYIEPDWKYPEYKIFTQTSVGLLYLLKTRIVAYKAGTPDRSVFTSTPAESIMKTLVHRNAGSGSGEDDGRIRTGYITGITVEEDQFRGEVKDWYCAYDNLLETLQKLASVGGGDFDLVKTDVNTFEFRFYPGQLGEDRSADIVFSVEKANMKNPTYSRERLSEATVALAGGRETGSDRRVRVVTSQDYDWNNDIEIFVNATHIETENGLDDYANSRLETYRSKETFSFEVAQTPSTVYRRDYDLGDLVSVLNPFTGETRVQKITAVYLGVDNSGETLKFEFETP